MALSILALCCLVGAALAGPFQRDAERRCSAECPLAQNEKFHYEPGSKYIYSFKGLNVITVAGNQRQTAGQTGTAEIHVTDKCEMFLQLKNVQLSSDLEREVEAELIERLERLPLSFAWVDGKIEHVCASPDESPDSENIKKGILSVIINTMPDWQSSSRQQEVDSLGSCDTKYTVVRKQGDEITIRKEKSLESCDNRQNGFSALISQEYSSPQSDVHSLPILSEEKMVCEQQIRRGIYQHIICKEQGVIKPLANYESVVEFQTEVQLTLKRVEKSSQMHHQQSSERKDIRFNMAQNEDVESKERDVSQVLTELCPLTEGVLHPKVSKLYYKLIVLLKGLPAESVQKIYKSLKDQQICSSPKTLDIFLDALPMAGTEGSIKLMVELLRRKEVSGLKTKLWPASFALIPHPNAEAIAAILPLLSEEHKSRPVLLGLSAMIHRVCSKVNCDRIPSVREATQILHQSLGSRCSVEDEDELISTLKAFGNMGYLGEAESTILQCAKAQDKHISIRLAAIEAFRRYQKQIPSELTELYASSEESFEVRISALKTIIKNADSSIVRIIQKVLDQDQDEQVVAYTMSLVNNWKKTESPLKQSVSELLQEVEMRREDIKYWENSKNIELSKFNVPMNLGASMEADVIHTSENKIPRSLSSRLDVDLFGRNVNLLEFGARVEGLEKALKKLLGMDQSQSSKRSWLPLQSRQDSEFEKPEATFYLRTMGTEFLDFSVSDLSSVGNMVQVADVINKLAQGEQVDFAHSFLFLNTKLVLQSVTGRSYTFGMTGSATAGLTANGKFDIIHLLSSPSNCDIEGRLQPSANLEFVATVGIHSEKSRPDIKIVTSMHTGSDLGAKLRIKDSHLAEARLDMPSEEIHVLKISTELFEVDANNNEKRIADQMEQKIDTCLRSLEKPLGIQICAQLETPKPLVSRQFPYTRGIGNLQLAIRKTDRSMQGYSASIEIPKHRSNSMTYKMVVDTPGSSVKRSFQANLQVKKAPSGERQFQLDLQSPFKELSSTGTYTWRKDLVEGAINVVSDRSQKYSMKAVMEMDLSSSKKTLKPTLQWTLPGDEPVTVAGSVVFDEGRKQHIMIDLRSNKPESTPIVISGNLVKEGPISLSKSAQWKMSADLIAKTPLITTKAHSTVAKRSGQAQAISSSLSIDYNTPRSSKESIKFSTEVHHSSAKIGAAAQFESTQKPQFNWVATWDMQGRVKAAMKNDIMVKYGRNQERSYVQIAQMYQHGDTNTLSEGKILMKAPQFNIDSELAVSANLHARRASNIQLEADLRYKSNKHIKTQVQLKHVSQKPIKMVVKAALEYPGRKMLYEDEIMETAQNVYEGKSKLQWQENQSASLKYKYKKLGDRSVMHHEIESVLTTPFMRSPITHKGLVKVSEGKLQFETELNTGRQSHSIEAKLFTKGTSYLQVKLPVVEGKIEATNEIEKKAANVDVQLKTRSPRHIIGLASLQWESKRKVVRAELALDADRNPSQKLEMSAEIELNQRRSGMSHKVASKIQILDILTAEVSSKAEDGDICSHQISIDVSGRQFEPKGLTVQQEITKDSIHSNIVYRKHQVEFAQAELQGKLIKKSSGKELQVAASIKSQDGSFENKEFALQHKFAHSGSSLTCRTSATLELQAGKVHEAEIEYTSEARQSKQLKVMVKTPYSQFREQGVKLSLEKNSDSRVLHAVVEQSGKTITLSSTLKQNRNEVSVSSTLKTPFSAARDVKFYAKLENQRYQQQAESHFELNGERKYDINASYKSKQGQREAQASLKTPFIPDVAINMKSEQNQQSFNHEITVTADSARILLCKLSRQSEDEFNGQLEVRTKRNTILDIKASKEAKSSDTKKYSLKAKGQFTPISLALQLTQSEEGSISQTLQICREASSQQCYKIKGYYKKESQQDKYDKYRKVTFDIEKVGERGSLEHLCNIHYLLSVEGQTIKSKLLIERQQKSIGYEIAMKGRRNSNEPLDLELNVQLPSRKIQTTVSALHSQKQTLVKMEFAPDASDHSQKWAIHVQRDSRNKEVSGQLGLMHPALEKPVTVVYSLQKGESDLPVAAKVEIDYSSDSKDKIIAEISIQSEQSRQRQQVIVAHLQSQASHLDFTVKVSKQQARQNDLYICEWSWQSENGVKKGQLEAKISQSSGQDQTSEIKYTSSSSQLTLVAHSTWEKTLPSEVQMQLLSRSQMLAEVHYQQNGPCYEMEIKQSAPVWKHKLCYSQMEDRRLKLISFEAYHQRKCMDINLEFDASKAHVANFAADWDKQELKQTLKSFQQFRELMPELPVKKVQREVQHKSKAMLRSLKEKLMKPLASAAKQQMRLLTQELQVQSKEILRALPQLPQLPSLQEIQKQIYERIVQWFEYYKEEALRYLDQEAPEWVKELYEKVKEYVEKLMAKYCSRSSFCYKLKRSYEKHGMRQVRRVLRSTFDEQMQQMQKSSQLKYNRVIDGIAVFIKNAYEWIDEMTSIVRRKLPTIENSVIYRKITKAYREYVEYVENKIRDSFDRFVEYFNKFMDNALDNEFFQTLMREARKIREEAMRALKKMNVQKMLQPLKTTVLEKYPKNWIQERIQVQEYDPKQGHVRIQFRYPFDQSGLQLLKNAMIATKNKYLPRK